MAHAERLGDFPQRGAGQMQPSDGGVIIRAPEENFPLGVYHAHPIRPRARQKLFV